MKPTQDPTELPRPSWLPALRREIWILAAGQLLLFIGQGFTLVYASIYFVNELGFSPTQVGLALSSSGLSGVLGRFVAGNIIDSAWFGRRGTLLLSAVVTALACFVLAFTDTFELLVSGNLLLGLGLSLYWPATLAVTTDLTTTDDRTEAFAVTRLVDNLGLGLGALLAGQYIALSGSYRALFLGKGVTYLLFGIVIYITIAETRQPQTQPRNLRQDWWQALSDGYLVTFLIANLFFTTYSAQLSSTLPLYLANFVPGGNGDTGFSQTWISYFFGGHALLKILLQLPVTRKVKPLNHITVLLIALLTWCGGFVLIWATGTISVDAWIFAVGAFSAIAMAEILYSPIAVAVVGEMAPVRLRGIYFALESECWAIGFTIGPTLGGWALDRPEALGSKFWLILLASTAIAATILLGLQERMNASEVLE
ncbi:MAG: MFS transporter [Cyanobacteriota bacterium]|nr:MFS transporter [Cyanobacteriota bacterium]